MPKQLHLSKDFFVNAPEEEARQHILQLPQCVTNIKFVEENRVRRSIRFIYERPTERPEDYNYVDVSLLPLNVHQTRVTLHGSCMNGGVSHKDFKINNTLRNVEAAIHAAVKGSIGDFEPQQEKTKSPNHLQIILALAALAGAYYLIRNLF